MTDADLVLGISNPDDFLGGGLRARRRRGARGVAPLGERAGPRRDGVRGGHRRDHRQPHGGPDPPGDRAARPRPARLRALGLRRCRRRHAGLFGRGLGVREVVFPLNNTGLGVVGLRAGLAALRRALPEPTSSCARRSTYDQLSPTLRPSSSTAPATTPRAHDMTGTARARAHRRHEVSAAGLRSRDRVPAGEVDDAFAATLLENFHHTYDAPLRPRLGLHRGRRDDQRCARHRARPSRCRAIAGRRRRRRDAGAGRARATGVLAELARRVADAGVLGAGDLRRGYALRGPTIVEYPHTTIAVRPGQALHLDDFGNIVLTWRINHDARRTTSLANERSAAPTASSTATYRRGRSSSTRRCRSTPTRTELRRDHRRSRALEVVESQLRSRRDDPPRLRLQHRRRGLRLQLRDRRPSSATRSRSARSRCSSPASPTKSSSGRSNIAR